MKSGSRWPGSPGAGGSHVRAGWFGSCNLWWIEGTRVRFKSVSRTTMMQYRKANKPVPQIGRELDVEYLIEGGVVKSGNRIRVTVQLITHARTSTSGHGRRQTLAAAKSAALRAVEIAPDLGAGHHSLGLGLTMEWPWEQAERELLESIRLEPGNALFHHGYGILCLPLQRRTRFCTRLRPTAVSPLRRQSRVRPGRPGPGRATWSPDLRWGC